MDVYHILYIYSSPERHLACYHEQCWQERVCAGFYVDVYFCILVLVLAYSLKRIASNLRGIS